VYSAGTDRNLVARSRWYQRLPGDGIEETPDGERLAECFHRAGGVVLASQELQPLLFETSARDPLVLFYKVGPSPSQWWGLARTSPDAGRTWSAAIALPAGMQVWLAAGATDMRKGFDGLSALVQTQLAEDAYSGQLFVFRGRAGDRVKILWWSGDGLCLFAKRLERGRFVWPQATHGTVALSGAQLSMLLEGIDWRRPIRTTDPQLSV